MNYKLLKTSDEVKDTLQRLNTLPYVVVDLETKGLDPWKDEIIDVQVLGSGEDCCYIFSSDYVGCLSSITTDVVGANLKFDITFLYRKGIDVTHWRYYDIQLIGHLVDENRDSYSLDSYVKELFNNNYKEEFWAKYKSYKDAPEEARYEYGSKDVVCTGRVYEALKERRDELGIRQELIDHVHRLQYSLLQTEVRGVRVDLDYLTRLGLKLKDRISDIHPQMRSMVPEEIEAIELELWSRELSKFKTDKKKKEVQRPEFNFGSSAQLKELLYGHLYLPIQHNEKTKQISTDYDSLQRIRDKHPLVGLIQEYRELEKVYTAYIDGTLMRVRDGHVYPEFRVNGTHTSRISHNNPNLGQLPKEGGVKGIYIADEGEVFSDHDYAQLEVCIEAHFTQDPNLLEIVLNGASKHDITAHSLGISRNLAKTVNFASQYFCGPKKLAQILGVSLKEAEIVHKKYWDTYSGVMKFKTQIDNQIDQAGYVTDLFGRRRRFPVRPGWAGDKAYRQGYNFVIQSTGGQCMNNAFYKASEWIRGNDRGRGGMWTVHDSGLFSHKEICHEENSAKVNEIMSKEGELVGLTVPLKVDFVTGCKRWLD